MNKKTYLKLYFSLLIFVFLIIIIPSVFFNMIGYIALGLARPVMFLSKFIDLCIFICIAMVINLGITFIIWLNIRTIKKNGKFVRTINGLDFDKSNILSIKKKRFGLMLLITFELNNYKNIHYFSNNSNELNKWLEEIDLLDLLDEKLYKYDKTRLLTKITILFFILLLVYRDAYTSNKTFRKGTSNVDMSSLFRPINYNNDYIVTHLNIYNKKTGIRTSYNTTSSWLKDDLYSYCNYPIDIEMYSNYFVVTFYSVHFYNQIAQGNTVKLLEEKIDYNGLNIGFIKDVEIDKKQMDEDTQKRMGNGSFNGSSIYQYILNKDYEISLGNKNDIYDYCYSKKGRYSCLNLKGNIKSVDEYKYFSLHIYKKRNDDRYIGLSGLYRYNINTEEIEAIKEFNGKRIISFDEKKIIYIDYKTVYKYDILTEKNNKIVNLSDYQDIAIYNSEKGIVIDCYGKNLQYFLGVEGNFIGKGKFR